MSIHFDKRRKLPWSARITLDGKRRYLGSFATEREAERTYDTERIIYDARKRFTEMSKNFTLENYRLRHEIDDSSFKWVETRKALRALTGRIRVNLIMALFAKRRK